MRKFRYPSVFVSLYLQCIEQTTENYTIELNIKHKTRHNVTKLFVILYKIDHKEELIIS